MKNLLFRYYISSLVSNTVLFLGIFGLLEYARKRTLDVKEMLMVAVGFGLVYPLVSIFLNLYQLKKLGIHKIDQESLQKELSYELNSPIEPTELIEKMKSSQVFKKFSAKEKDDHYIINPGTQLPRSGNEIKLSSQLENSGDTVLWRYKLEVLQSNPYDFEVYHLNIKNIRKLKTLF